jgi:hypothetical protein
LLKLQDQPEKMIASYRQYLFERFQTERRMHLLEAFVLGLIDEIQGVINGNALRQDAVHAESVNESLCITQPTKRSIALRPRAH